jgi:hypothetical protein
MVQCVRWGLPWLSVLAVSAMLTAALLLSLAGDERLSDCHTSLACGGSTVATPFAPSDRGSLGFGLVQHEIGGPNADD